MKSISIPTKVSDKGYTLFNLADGDSSMAFGTTKARLIIKEVKAHGTARLEAYLAEREAAFAAKEAAKEAKPTRKVAKGTAKFTPAAQGTPTIDPAQFAQFQAFQAFLAAQK